MLKFCAGIHCNPLALLFSRYLPNKVTEVIEHRAKVFSGHYSQDGSVFMSATQGIAIGYR